MNYKIFILVILFHASGICANESSCPTALIKEIPEIRHLVNELTDDPILQTELYNSISADLKIEIPNTSATEAIYSVHLKTLSFLRNLDDEVMAQTILLVNELTDDIATRTKLYNFISPIVMDETISSSIQSITMAIEAIYSAYIKNPSWIQGILDAEVITRTVLMDFLMGAAFLLKRGVPSEIITDLNKTFIDEYISSEDTKLDRSDNINSNDPIYNFKSNLINPNAGTDIFINFNSRILQAIIQNAVLTIERETGISAGQTLTKQNRLDIYKVWLKKIVPMFEFNHTRFLLRVQNRNWGYTLPGDVPLDTELNSEELLEITHLLPNFLKFSSTREVLSLEGLFESTLLLNLVVCRHLVVLGSILFSEFGLSTNYLALDTQLLNNKEKNAFIKRIPLSNHAVIQVLDENGEELEIIDSIYKARAFNNLEEYVNSHPNSQYSDIVMGTVIREKFVEPN